MSQPTTIEEAAERQLALWREAERTNRYPRDIRYRNLREGWTYAALSDGCGGGWFPVNTATGELCDSFSGRWMLDDQVLLCEHCFEDGT